MRRGVEPNGDRRAVTTMAVVFRIAIGACCALSLAVLLPRLSYLVRLAVAPDARARGELAADERLSPYAAAGQVKWRRELDRRAREGRTQASGLALAWTFFVDRRGQLPTGSRILLSRPNDALYEFGNFLWFPSRLEVAPNVVLPISDGEHLRQASARRNCSDRHWLRENGYGGCVEVIGAQLLLHGLGGVP